MKREREIDLNMQVLADELELHPKRVKVEDVSALSLDTVAFTGNFGNSNISVKVENSISNLPGGQLNGQVDVNHIQLEAETCSDSMSLPYNEASNIAEQKPCCEEDKGSVAKADMLNNLPENCELMNLVKLTGHSWIKNNKFLQEYAIRFLCVLSLDR